jgi:hypothetical protein
MLEIGILVFLLLAVGYWAALRVMGRRNDVLHGQFVEFDGEDAPAMATAAPVPQLSPVPRRPKWTAPKPMIATTPAPDDAALQSLLLSIKQELKNASQI